MFNKKQKLLKQICEQVHEFYPDALLSIENNVVMLEIATNQFSCIVEDKSPVEISSILLQDVADTSMTWIIEILTRPPVFYINYYLKRLFANPDTWKDNLLDGERLHQLYNIQYTWNTAQTHVLVNYRPKYGRSGTHGFGCCLYKTSNGYDFADPADF